MKDPRGSGLKTHVKTARKRSASSTRWLQRQLNDPYVAEARKQGYRSRAAFKLLEIDEKHPILKPGMTVVDLGAAPGGWTQIVVDRVRSAPDNILVVGIDLLDVEPIPGSILLTKDFLDEDAPQALVEALGTDKVDCVLSDMAAATTGHRKTDHLRTVHLFELAVDFAFNHLAEGGIFCAKVFRGGAENQLLAEMKRRFASVLHVKPPASRPESPELYVLARGFRGAEEQDGD